MESNGKWGGSLGNGTGLLVSEQDETSKITFPMHPELFTSYLTTITGHAINIHDETVYDTRYISFVSNDRGLVSLIARPSN